MFYYIQDSNDQFDSVSDFELCIYLGSVIFSHYDTLMELMSHYEYNTLLWRARYCKTLLGQLCIEIIEREITEDYFVEVYQYLTQNGV